MPLPPLLLLHIATAVVGVFCGTVAMSLRKGSPWHTWAGTGFTLAMLPMAASGAYLALAKAQTLNALVGALTFYLVTTAWLTLQSKDRVVRAADWLALCAACGIGALLVIDGTQAAGAADGLKDGEDAGGYLTFGCIAFVAAALDLRMLLRGVAGKQRIARHLWRMCFPMAVAVISATPRLARFLPKAFRTEALLLIPTSLILLAMAYFLIRVLYTKGYLRSIHRAA